jgi:acyl carrier protein
MPKSKRLKVLKERVKKTVISLSGIDKSLKIEEEDNLFSLGMSSRASVTLMLGLEDEFEIEFPEHMMIKDNFESINAIANAIEKIAN